MDLRLELLLYSLVVCLVSMKTCGGHTMSRHFYPEGQKNTKVVKGFTDERIQELEVKIPTPKPILIDGEHYPFPRNKSLDAIQESVTTFADNVYNLLNETMKDKDAFLKRLDDDEVTKILRKFDRPPCLGEPHYHKAKESFRLRFELLVVPLREAVTELLDNLQQVERSYALEKGILDLQLITCDYLDMERNCTNTSVLQLPNVSGTSYPANRGIDSVLFPKKTSKTRNVIVQNYKRFSTECGDDEFRCRDGQCIPLDWVCSGNTDCSDGSDENYSSCPRSCPEKRCRNLNCFNSHQICNGIDDCGDRTDEENCDTPKDNDKCTLKEESFLCSDKERCLPLKALCDGEQDCTYISDEGGSCDVTDGCDRCVSKGGACLRSPAGPLCLSSCPSGFVLDFETGVCVLSESSEGLRIIYKNYSFPGKINKINLLFKRVSNGLLLMKKYLNREMIKTVADLNMCMTAANRLFSGPFALSP